MTRLDPYDAVLVVSFGGPEGPDEVMPFLRRVADGRNIPEERLMAVAKHYDVRGGVSPINGETRALIAALREELDRRGEDLPILWGNRNSEPFLADTVREAREAGHRRLLVLLTSAYSSYSSCRQYRENLADALAALTPIGDAAPDADLEESRGMRFDKVRPFAGDAPGEGLPSEAVRLLFVTHSIPESMAQTSGPPGAQAYVRQHLQVAGLVADGVAERLGTVPEWSLVYCSRSGPPHQPWLEPDVEDALEDLAAQGVRGVVAAPIGFVADHMEVVNDLDDDAAARAAELGLAWERVPTVRDDPRFVAGLVDLLEARAAEARGEVGAGDDSWVLPGGPCASVCPAGCCRNPRGERPALCGVPDPGDAVPAPAPAAPAAAPGTTPSTRRTS